MASEVKRSINLEYQADLKQLIAQLEKMPGITAQEAKKMVSVLDTNFRRAEKAAKRSQEASKKAAREAQRAFQEIDTRGAEAGLEAVSPGGRLRCLWRGRLHPLRSGRNPGDYRPRVWGAHWICRGHRRRRGGPDRSRREYR
jgi:hypothetical protein